jgi:hypothetical protein
MQSLEIFLCNFLNKYSKIWPIEILYKAILHKIEFGQAHCKDLVKIILRKFILYFYEISTNLYEFFMFKRISGVFKRSNEKKKTNSAPGLISAQGLVSRGPAAHWL